MKHASSPFLAPFDGSFHVKKAATEPDRSPDKDQYKKHHKKLIAELDERQRLLYAQDRYAVLFIFQAMDAAGKDSTIRAVMRGIDPAGCQVHSFKQPSAEELDHDFLWRTAVRMPERGRIGIFNRSYYEEVLVVKVHPTILKAQKLPTKSNFSKIWRERYESITDFEKHLARNGTVIVKFWLNVSNQEQRRRFLSRLEQREKNWKFSSNDVAERKYWRDYMGAYEDMINATAKPWAPWYVIPADNKPFMRLQVAQIMVDTLANMPLRYPTPDDDEKALFDDMIEKLKSSA